MTAISKQAIRQRKLQQRNALTAPYSAKAGYDAAAIAFNLFKQWDCRVIGLYWPMRGEIDTRPLAAMLRDSGITCLLPRIVKASKILSFAVWHDSNNTGNDRNYDDEKLVNGKFGTMEPAPDCAIMMPDTLIVPLSAFDRRGHRIGYGGGYYDKTISSITGTANLDKIKTCGFCYAVQEVETVPNEAHDMPLAAIVTELEHIDPEGF